MLAEGMRKHCGSDAGPERYFVRIAPVPYRRCDAGDGKSSEVFPTTCATRREGCGTRVRSAVS